MAEPTSATVTIGLDVGGTAIKAVALDTADQVVFTGRRATNAAAGPEAVLAGIAAFAEDVVRGCARPVAGVGVAIPGLVDPQQGIGRYSANLGWTDAPVAAAVGDRVARPVRVDHDVRSAARAEARLGAARGLRDFLFLAIGTGIAGALTIGGTLVAGSTGGAGELGHVPVVPDGEPCACGQLGCLETYASAAALQRRYRAAGGGERDSAYLVTARTSDPLAGRVWADATSALGLALAGYTLIADPRCIVLGGGLAQAGEALRAAVRAELARRLAWRPAPEVALAELGDAAGAIGAALLGRDAAMVASDQVAVAPGIDIGPAPAANNDEESG